MNAGQKRGNQAMPGIAFFRISFTAETEDRLSGVFLDPETQAVSRRALASRSYSDWKPRIGARSWRRKKLLPPRL